MLSFYAIIVGIIIIVSSVALDRLSTCADPYKTVYESDLIITARSNVAPFNPQTDCTVYLESAYQVWQL